MTIETLLDCSVEKLESLSDQEIEEYFAPFFNVTRPVKKLDTASEAKLLTTEDVAAEINKRVAKVKKGKGVLTPEAQARFEKLSKMLESQQ